MKSDYASLTKVATDPESTPAGLCFISDTDPEFKIFEKTDPDKETLFIFGSGRNLHALYKCHSLSKNTAEFQLHRWLPESEQESDSQIWKKSGPDPDPDSKFLEQERNRGLKMWFRPPLVTPASSVLQIASNSLYGWNDKELKQDFEKARDM